MRSRGFTLVEILVVIGIILVLAGLMLPVYARAKDSGQRTTCLSNLSQIYVGTLLYVADSDDNLPVSLNAWTKHHIDWFPTIDPTIPAFQVALAGYVHDAEVFRCPSDWGTDSEWGPYVRPSMFVVVGSSYRTNNILKPTPMASVEAPTLATLARDASGAWHVTRPGWGQERFNILHLDGHVSFDRGFVRITVE